MDKRILQDSVSKRHMMAYADSITINYIHYKKPWVVACWSAFFPGYGHLMLCKYLTSFMLIAWELALNTLSKLNAAIFYSLTGQFEKVKHVLNINFLLLYVPVYVFCIWDSYRRTVSLNRVYALGYTEDNNMMISNISGLELNILEKRKPHIAYVWSLIFHGLGYFYIGRILSFLFGVSWIVIIIRFANLLPAIHYTLLGNFSGACEILNPQWLLYLPSIYGFTSYDSYVNAVEYNELFEKEQASYLRTKYQDKNFKMPV